MRKIMAYSNSPSTRITGDIGEVIACRYLICRGFRIERRNYRKAWGELDIVAIKDNIIHFFEVKSVMRSLNQDSYSHEPEENVHGLKINHIRRVIQTYLEDTKRGFEAIFYFHVLCVYMDKKKRIARVKWIKEIVL